MDELNLNQHDYESLVEMAGKIEGLIMDAKSEIGTQEENIEKYNDWLKQISKRQDEMCDGGGPG